jgi:hypothetical protein
MNKVKIALLKVLSSSISDQYENYDIHNLIGLDWKEVDQSEVADYVDAVNVHNTKSGSHRNPLILMVQESEASMQLTLDNLYKHRNQLAAEIKRRQAEHEQAEHARKAKAALAKKKRLAKTLGVSVEDLDKTLAKIKKQ